MEYKSNYLGIDLGEAMKLKDVGKLKSGDTVSVKDGFDQCLPRLCEIIKKFPKQKEALVMIKSNDYYEMVPYSRIKSKSQYWYTRFYISNESVKPAPKITQDILDISDEVEGAYHSSGFRWVSPVLRILVSFDPSDANEVISDFKLYKKPPKGAA